MSKMFKEETKVILKANMKAKVRCEKQTKYLVGKWGHEKMRMAIPQ